MRPPNHFSRRDFLKLAGMSLTGLAFSSMPSPAQPPFSSDEVRLDEEGRVADDSISVYLDPTYESSAVASYPKDTVLTITAVALSADLTAYNRVWYRIGDEGYAYSGAIQPVDTTLNDPINIPAGGAVAEVSVPFTDAYFAADPNAKLAYRCYFSTTYWLTKMVSGADGDTWYEFYDDKDNSYYYIKSKYLRVIPLTELAPLSPDVPQLEKTIIVKLNDQLVIAYEGDKPVFVTRAATGGRVRTGSYSTPVGDHHTYHKRPSRHMAAGNLARFGFDLPGIPWVSYMTPSGVSFHGTYWHNDFGHPRSHGCVNLTPQAARWIYLWTMPSVPADKNVIYRPGEGTLVHVIE